MQITQHVPSYVTVGGIDDFLPRIGRVVRLQGKEIVIFRLSGDRFAALDNVNAHQKGGPLCEGIVSGDFVYDPLYNRKISLLEGIVQDSADVVKTYPVRVMESIVQICPEDL